MKLIKKEKLAVFPHDGQRSQKYKFSELCVGDCYTFQGSDIEIKRVRSAATSYSNRSGIVLRTMKNGDRIMVWRAE